MYIYTHTYIFIFIYIEYRMGENMHIHTYATYKMLHFHVYGLISILYKAV